MTHFVNYHFSIAMQKERLPKKQLRIMHPHRPKVTHRLYLRMGIWLSGVGDWLIQRGQYQNENSQDLELA